MEPSKDQKELNKEIEEQEKFESFEKFLSDNVTQKDSLDKAIIDISERLSLSGTKLEKILTELNDYEITRISLLESINDTYIDSKLIKGFIDNLLVYRISKDRKGREDLKGLIKSLAPNFGEDKTGAFERFKMRLRG